MTCRHANTPTGLLLQAAFCASLLLCALVARAQPAPAQVVDIPTCPGVTQRFLYLAPAQPKAAVILYAGGHGGLQIYPNGEPRLGCRQLPGTRTPALRRQRTGGCGHRRTRRPSTSPS
ncbi:hypothetical protein ACU4GD_08905 [Cupriavidus basilensis]